MLQKLPEAGSVSNSSLLHTMSDGAIAYFPEVHRDHPGLDINGLITVFI